MRAFRQCLSSAQDVEVADAPGNYLIATLGGQDVAALQPDVGFATMIRRPGYGDHLEAGVERLAVPSSPARTPLDQEPPRCAIRRARSSC